MSDAVKCMQASEQCRGPVAYRMALSGSGESFPRCEGHWSARLDLEDDLRRRYPSQQPSDFDPAYAGESWYEDD
jgi:hypothetical protein